MIRVLTACSCSSTDWKFAAEQFVKELPDKVFAHCKDHSSLIYSLESLDDHILIHAMLFLFYF